MNRTLILGVALTLSAAPSLIAGDLVPGAQSTLSPAGLEVVSCGLILPEGLTPQSLTLDAASGSPGEYRLTLENSGLVQAERPLLASPLQLEK
jgi:hypothetical protein